MYGTPWLLKWCESVALIFFLCKCNSDPHSESSPSVIWVNFSFIISVLFILWNVSSCMLWHWQEMQSYAGIELVLLFIMYVSVEFCIIQCFLIFSTNILKCKKKYNMDLYLIWIRYMIWLWNLSWDRIITQLIKRVSAFYGPWRFISIFTGTPCSVPDESSRHPPTLFL
jgi:hypothetical protein